MMDGMRHLLWGQWSWIHRAITRARLIPCDYCGGKDDACDCGVWGIPWEVTGGAHETWCMRYHGCPYCKRNTR